MFKTYTTEYLIQEKLKYITDITWNPVTNKMSPEYLSLTYGPSSHMEYPENWKERMRRWEVTIETMENVNKLNLKLLRLVKSRVTTIKIKNRFLN